MGKVLDYKCPCCDAVLKFNPHGGNWKCDYCRNEYTLDDLKQQEVNLEKDIKTETKKESLDNYNCPNCGASIIALENTSTTTCPYCRNTTILKDKLEGENGEEYKNNILYSYCYNMYAINLCKIYYKTAKCYS